MKKYVSGLLIFIAVIFILFIGKPLLMPLTLAFIAWFIIKELLFYINKLQLKGKKIPLFIQNTLAFFLVVGAISVFGSIIISSANNVQDKIPEYQENLNVFIQNINLPIAIAIDYKVWLQNFMEGFDFSGMLGLAVSSVSAVFGKSVLILLYLIFILIESSSFKKKLQKLYPIKQEKARIDAIVTSVNRSMSRYITLKTFTSFLTGFLSYLALTIIGVDFAIFWAYLIFILNFIPTIGSLIGTIFPVLLAFAQFGTWVQPSIVLFIVAGIQLLVGNILEPRLMGNSLNVSPLVVLISLAFWSWLWGVVGMIISVPITIMLIIVCTQFENLRWLAIVLSRKGELPLLEINQDEV
jgi:predicted PurR-regulated permease PerM